MNQNELIQAPMRDIIHLLLTNIGHDYKRAMLFGALGKRVVVVLDFMIERGILSISSDNLPVPTDEGIRWFLGCADSCPTRRVVAHWIPEGKTSFRDLSVIPRRNDLSCSGLLTAGIERPHVPRRI